MDREFMEFDVVIVGAGPAGLAAAIRLRQLSAEAGHEVSVCVLEKGSEAGAHILSGAVMEPRALNELLPDWQERGAPLNTPVTEDRLLLLTRGGAMRLPTPPQMHNEGNYIISLGNLCRWLGEQAENLGVEIFPGFAAAEVVEAMVAGDVRRRGWFLAGTGFGFVGEDEGRCWVELAAVVVAEEGELVGGVGMVVFGEAAGGLLAEMGFFLANGAADLGQAGAAEPGRAAEDVLVDEVDAFEGRPQSSQRGRESGGGPSMW